MFTRFSEVVVSFLETKESFFFFFPFLATTAGNKLTLSKNCHFLLGEGAEEGDPCSPTPQAQPGACPPGPACSGSLLGDGAGQCVWEVRGGPQLWALGAQLPGPRGCTEGFLYVSRVERCFYVFIFNGPEISLLTGIFDLYFLRVWHLMFVNPA